MKLVFATHNQHKLQEVQAMLPNFTIVDLTTIGCTEDIDETAPTLQGNAILKANYISKKYKINCFADDTGLEIEALNNEPGVYSARYAGEHGNSEANTKKVLVNLQGKTNRKAQFKTIIALNLDNKQFLFEGVCKGTILQEKQGLKGFGYDPIFKPLGFNKSFAEMTLDQKSKISHRGKAIQKLVDFLNSL